MSRTMAMNIFPAQRSLLKVARLVLSVLPCFVYSWFTGDSMGAKFALASFSLFYVLRTFRWGISAIVLHQLMIVFGIILLIVAQQSFWLFAIVCTLWGIACMGLTGFGKSYRTLGSFILIPSLYLSLTFAASFGVKGLESHAQDLFIWSVVALIGPLIVHCLAFIFDEKHQILLRWDTEITPDWNRKVLWTVLSIAIAIFTTTLFVEYYHVPEAKWVIWSSVAVITGEFDSMHRKLVHRVGGAAFGLVSAFLILLAVPIPSVYYDFAGVLIIVTLCIPKYPVAYGLRSMLVALAAGGMAQSVSMGEHRLFNVFVGDFVGVASAYLVSYLSMYYYRLFSDN